MGKAAFLAAVEKATAVDKLGSAIIFGPSGVGKTIFAASSTAIGDYAPVLIVDVEGSAAGVGRLYPDVDVIKADTFEKLESIKWSLLNEEHPYKTVVFDTLNVAQDRAEAHFKVMYPGNSFGVWDELKKWTVDFCRDFHHSDMMVFFIAHSKQDKDDTTGRIETTVKIRGSAVSDVPTVVDLVGYMAVEQDGEGKMRRVMYVSKHPNIVTKNRFGLEDKIYDPDMLTMTVRILEAAENDKEKDSK